MGHPLLAGEVRPRPHSDLPLRPTVRWMTAEHIRAAAEIDFAGTPWDWTGPRMAEFLARRGCMGRVAESAGSAVGFALYEARRPTIEVHKLVVDAEYRGLGVGEALVRALAAKLDGATWGRLLINVRETNLDGQLFLREQGFLGRRVIRGHFPDSGEDAFEMVLTADRARLARPGFLGRRPA